VIFSGYAMQSVKLFHGIEGVKYFDPNTLFSGFPDISSCAIPKGIKNIFFALIEI
jgi:hypothetical protein